MNEILKNENAKSFKIVSLTLPYVDDLIKHTFAYWHTRVVVEKTENENEVEEGQDTFWRWKDKKVKDRD